MTEQPDPLDATPTPAVDDVAPTVNLFDAPEPPPSETRPGTSPAEQAIPQGPAAPRPPADDGVGNVDSRAGADGPGDDGPDDGGQDGPDDGGQDEDAGPDWEQLAALDPRTSGELLEALHLATTSRDDYLDALQRKQAEFENFRRRMQGQTAQQRVAGHADVAGRVLEVLDDFDRTLASIAATADEGVVKGVTLVRDKLLAGLREVGLERVDDQGAPFDPNRHEAVQQVSGDGIVGDDGEPVVAEVLRPGYVLGDRVLRAAMVAVAQ